MGIDKKRFVIEPFEELTCAMCMAVLVDPLMCPDEHVFCRTCITDWIKIKATCPVNQSKLVESQLRPPPKVLIAMIGDLKIRCDFVDNGCTEIVKLSQLPDHVANCPANKFRSVAVQAILIGGDLNQIKTEMKDDVVFGSKRHLQAVEDPSKKIKTEKESEDILKVLNSEKAKVENELWAIDAVATLTTQLTGLKSELANHVNTIKEHEATLARVRQERQFYFEQLHKRNQFIANQAVENMSKPSASSAAVAEPTESTKSSEIVSKPSASSNVDPRLTKSSSSSTTQILNKLLDKNNITVVVYKTLIAVDFDKFFEGDQDTKSDDIEASAFAIRNAMRRIKNYDLVLNLVECPFVAVCLAVHFPLCKFVISQKLKTSILKNGFDNLITSGRLILGPRLHDKFDRFENIGSVEDGPFDVVLNDYFFVAKHIISRQLKSGCYSYDIVRDKMHFSNNKKFMYGKH